MHDKSLLVVRCDVCDKEMLSRDAFAVIQVAGFLAHGFLSGQNDKVIKYYLCSSACRSKHIGTFWRRHFPVEEQNNLPEHLEPEELRIAEIEVGPNPNEE